MPINKALVAVLALSFGAPCQLLAAAPADGELDTTFSDDGKHVIPFDQGASDTDMASDAVVDSLGRTYVVGTVSIDGASRIGVSRLNADGTVDDTYGDEANGFVGPDSQGFSITGVTAALDPQGFLLVGGSLTISNNSDFAVCRLNPSGALINFVGSNLACVQHAFDLSPTATADRVFDMAIQSDGKIVLAGSAVSSINPLVVEGAVMRLDPDGTRDDTFGIAGKTRLLPDNQDIVRLKAVAIQENGKIVMVGECSFQNFSDTDPCAARLEIDGDPDLTFFPDGLRNYSGDIDAGENGSFDGIALTPAPDGDDADQSFVAVGKIAQPGGGFDGLVARVEAISDLDESLSNDGFLVDNFGASLDFVDVEVESSGAITVGGTETLINDDRVFYATRFLRNGTRDGTDFGILNGVTAPPVLAQTKNDLASAMVFQKDRIVIVGSVERVNAADFDFGVIALQRDRIFKDGLQLID